jgi:hypothetical protein
MAVKNYWPSVRVVASKNSRVLGFGYELPP